MPVSYDKTTKNAKSLLKFTNLLCPCYFCNFNFRQKISSMTLITTHLKFQESKQDEEVENVRVVVRVRPLETNAGKNIVVTDKSSRTVTVQKPSAANEPPKVYQFDSVFGEDSKQVSSSPTTPLVSSKKALLIAASFVATEMKFTTKTKFSISKHFHFIAIYCQEERKQLFFSSITKFFFFCGEIEMWD